MHSDEIELIMMAANEAMDKVIAHLNHELAKVRTGKASTNLVNDLMVSYYGTMTPLNQVANISTSDARTISIQPWEKTMLSPIEKAIFEANLGITPRNDGEKIHLAIPPLTEERRRDLVKQAKKLGEEAKVGIRNARQKAMDAIKKEVKNGFSEDAGKTKEGQIQGLVDNHIKSVDNMVAVKEKDVMTV